MKRRITVPAGKGSASRPVSRVPGVDRRVGIDSVTADAILDSNYHLVRENRRERHIVEQDFLDPVVDLLSLRLIHDVDALGAEFVDLLVLVLNVIRAVSALGRYRIALDAIAIIRVGVEQRVPSDHQRIVLALDTIVTPNDRGGHILDRHLDVYFLKILLND